jgi:hypothetical protein
MNPPYPSPHGNGAPGPPNGPSIYGSAGGPVGPGGGAGVGGGVGGPSSAEWSNVLGQLDNLARTQAAMQQHMSNLSADYQAVIGEMINFQRNMVAQDQLMQNMIQYLVSLEAGESRLSIFHRSVDAKSLFFALGEIKNKFRSTQLDFDARLVGALCSFLAGAKAHLVLHRSRPRVVRSNG